MTITEFLEARITEDEAFITAPRGFTGHDVHLSDPIGAYSPRCPTCVGVHSGERMKAECAAKRAIITAHPVIVQLWWEEQCEIEVCETCQEDSYPDQWPCPTIEALAAVYKDHPDYAPEWSD